MPYYYEDGPTVGDYSNASCGPAMYGGGGGGGGGDGNGADDSDGVFSMSGGGNSSNGSEFDDDTSSWTEYSASYEGDTSVSSSGSDTAHADGKKKTKTRRGKWMKALWTLADLMDGERGREKRRDAPPPQQQPVKTILRPPTTYKYVIGMSGCPSKVPVYPRWM